VTRVVEAVMSRAQRRRDDQARHDLAETLVSLSKAALARLPMDESVREAVALAASIKQHGAHRRELRHLATVLRFLDDQAFDALRVEAEMLQKSTGARGDASAIDEAVELWARDLLKDIPGSLDRLHEQFPDADMTRVRQLVRNCRSTKDDPEAPSTSSAEAIGLQSRSRARLLRYLSELMDAHQ
jgi:ribosome-associated protein